MSRLTERSSITRESDEAELILTDREMRGWGGRENAEQDPTLKKVLCDFLCRVGSAKGDNELWDAALALVLPEIGPLFTAIIQAGQTIKSNSTCTHTVTHTRTSLGAIEMLLFLLLFFLLDAFSTPAALWVYPSGFLPLLSCQKL